MSASQKNSNRQGVVYSTDPDFAYNINSSEEQETLPVAQQNLRILLDKKARAGKKVTLITGFIGKEDDLKDLAKIIKTKCSVGGAVKDREVVIQGDLREKVSAILLNLGYRCKVI